MNTGEIIKECRERRGLTRSQAAELCNTSYSAIKNLECSGGCRVDTFETILHGLGYEFDIMPVEDLEHDLVKCKHCIYWQRHGNGYSWCTTFEKQFNGEGFCPEGARRPDWAIEGESHEKR